jgi:thiol:disulfide interchange protein DsbD
MIWTLLGVFVGGLALNLTPCIYPLVPITLSYFGTRTGQSRRSLAVHGCLYIAGLSVTNSILGVAAALTGTLMGSAMQSPIVLVLIAGVLVFFASSLFGFWELRLPGRLTNAASKTYSGYAGSLFMGLTLGIVAAPCLGPFVLGLLTWVGTLGSPWLGFLVFFTLSLGLGMPLLFLAIFSGSIDRLPGSGEWMLWVRKLMGWVLIGMAAYFLMPLFNAEAQRFVLAAVALCAAIHLGWIDRTRGSFRAFRWLKTGTALAGLVLAAFLAASDLTVRQGVAWQPYSDQVLAEAQDFKKPVIMDFSAAWCTPCREMEEVTFRDPEVVRRASMNFVMVKVDVTRSGDAAYERALTRYAVKGVPTVIFLDAEGKERADLRLVGYLSPDKFLTRMAQVKLGSESPAPLAHRSPNGG